MNPTHSQFSARILMLVLTVYLAGLAIARWVGPAWLPIVAIVVGAVSGVSFFPRNCVKSGTIFGSIGGIAGSLGLHSMGATVAWATLGAVLGYIIGQAAVAASAPASSSTAHRSTGPHG